MSTLSESHEPWTHRNTNLTFALGALTMAACTGGANSSDNANIHIKTSSIQLGQPETGFPAVGDVLTKIPKGGGGGGLQRLDDLFETCTGVLVHPNYILTAAHCLPLASFRVGTTPADFVTYPIDSAIEHPTEDMVLAHLATPILDIAPLPYNADNNLPPIGLTCTAVGFGFHNERDGTVTVDNKRSCTESILSADASTIRVLMGSGIADHGDSGGPLLCGGLVVGVVRNHVGDGEFPAHTHENYTTIDAAWIRQVTPPTSELLDTFFLGQNGAGQPNGIRVQSLLPDGNGGLTFVSQDVNAAYGVDDMANWKVAGDLNGDGRPDLVDTFYLGQNSPGQPSGLRVQTLLSTGTAAWGFTLQDVNAAYGVDDMANWKVAGDLNGDGRPDLVDTFYLGQNGPGHANGLRVQTLLSTGPGTWAFTFQDVNSAYGVDDMANWKVAGDLNGDGLPDLVDTFYLGQNGPGHANGLRVQTLLSTGPGTWVLTFQDVNAAYGVDDMANWKSAGDLNGDGRPDLVDTFYLGQNGPGHANGLRVHALLSTGPGTWAFTFQDVSPAYGVNDMANWKSAGDLNGDGRPDLVDTFYLGQNGPGHANGLRVQTLRSTGAGTWVLDFQDIAPAYGVNDMANWKVATDLNGDGRPDLFDTFYLGQNGPGQPSGLRVHTALSRADGTWVFGLQDVSATYGKNDMSNWKASRPFVVRTQ